MADTPAGAAVAASAASASFASFASFPMAHPDQPILIAGAGPVGLCAALALHHAGHAVRVIDAKAQDQLGIDPRAVALSHGSRLILDRLGVWDSITGPAAGTPIRHIHVSQSGGFGQTRIEAADYGIDALGYVTRLGPMVKALLGAVLRAGIEIRFETVRFETAHLGTTSTAGATSAADADNTAPLTIIAEGRPHEIAERKEYGQTAIVTEAWSAAPHGHRAYERFTPEGPLALLPLGSAQAGGHSVVWCMRDEHALALLQKSDAEFIGALNTATSFAQRTWTRIAPRAAFPLVLVRARDAARTGEIALGNAAQTLHPVAGQGLNLGLRDAFELAEALKHGLADGALTAYRKQRARDRRATVAITDQYVSLFSNDLALVRAARGIGLALFNLLPGARRLVARRMMFGLR